VGITFQYFYYNCGFHFGCFHWWVTPEEEQQRAEAMKRSDEWFKQHPPKHRTPPQPPPPRPTVKFGRKGQRTFCTNFGEPDQSRKFCLKCGTKLEF
jgi:hypothetical protein